MKFWISHENRYGESRVANSVAFSKEEALQLAEAHNKYLSTSGLSLEFLVLDIQEIEIDSDYLIYLLMQNFHVIDWRKNFLYMADRKDSSIKFGEIIVIPSQERVILT
jgi:hypothetical protein